MTKFSRAAVLLALLMAAVLNAPSHTHAQAAAQDESVWFCPMHPDITSDVPGRCRKCTMTLVAGNPFDTREHGFEVVTSPAGVRAVTPFTLRLRVRRPGSNEVVTAFETVHEKKLHLFLVSHDMTEFQHIHPEMDASGEWAIETSVPKPGYYRVLADFLPTGGGPQFLGRTLATVDYARDLERDTSSLAPDTVLTKQVDGMSATLSFEPATLLAGGFGHLDFALADARTGEAVTDLQPYLGAYGHTLVLSDDLADVVHAHPTELYSDDGVRLSDSGPRLRFEGYMPRPGVYRAWTQVQRQGRVSTFSFTFRVYSPYEAYKDNR